MEQWSHPNSLHTAKAARLGYAIPPLTEYDPTRPVFARVHRGVWMADCECGGAGFVWLDKHFFLCSDCGGPAWRPVVFPDPETRVGIESVLAARKPLNRNWEPGETVSHLVIENLSHDLSASLP